MDGHAIEVEPDAVEVVVTMADCTRHLYREEPGRSADASIFGYVARLGSA